MTTAITLRVPNDQAVEVDRVVADGRFPSRTALYVAAVEAWLRLDRSARLDAAIVDGYRRVPPTAAEGAAASETADRSVMLEPW